MLPHLEGAFCPEFNPLAKGVFSAPPCATGVPTSSAPSWKVWPSCSNATSTWLKAWESRGNGYQPGWRGASPLWLQIKADVLQKPVQTVQVEEAACLGAAILGAVTAGVYPTIASAVSQMVRYRDVLRPDSTHCQVYQQRYEDYVALYNLLTPMFTRINEVNDMRIDTEDLNGKHVLEVAAGAEIPRGRWLPFYQNIPAQHSRLPIFQITLTLNSSRKNSPTSLFAFDLFKQMPVP